MCLFIIKFPEPCIYLPDLGTLLSMCSILCW